MRRSFRCHWSLGVFVTLGLVGSCSAYDFGEVPVVEVSVDAQSPTWENGIQALVEAKCDNCHGAAESRFDPGEIRDRPALRFSISDSEEAFAPYGERAFVRVFQSPDKPMPPTYGTPLTEKEKAALRTYLDAKGFNPETRPEPSPEEGDTFVSENCANVDAALYAGLTFAGDLATPVQNCTGCHIGAATYGGGLDLSTAEQWKLHRNKIVFVLLTDDVSKQMPLGRSASFLDEGQPGRILANYACVSSEVLP